jgi:hypothetical protein
MSKIRLRSTKHRHAIFPLRLATMLRCTNCFIFASRIHPTIVEKENIVRLKVADRNYWQQATGNFKTHAQRRNKKSEKISKTISRRNKRNSFLAAGICVGSVSQNK